MSDDLDALLAEVEIRCPGGSGLWSGLWSGEFQLEISDPELARRLAAAVRDLQADYTAALDVIARLTEGWDPAVAPGGDWYLEPILADNEDEPRKDPMTDREWRVYCDAAQRATRNGT